MISKGRESYDPLPSDLTEADIAAHYFGLKCIPCLINSPLRKDVHASFGFYSPDGISVLYRDFATGEHGHLFSLLQRMWNCSFTEMIKRIAQTNFSKKIKYIRTTSISKNQEKNLTISCQTREWREEDINYWKSFGISKEWLIFADVHPISYIILKYRDYEVVHKMHELAYAFAEFKDAICTLKIYQPLSKRFKWMSSHDKSVISLWTKIPEKGERICICSSLKDALCLWANLNIPAIAPQGEGYKLKDVVIYDLRNRFSKVFICFDNDKAGLKYAENLQAETRFTNIILPPFEGGKDISDYYKIYHTLQPLKHLFYDT